MSYQVIARKYRPQRFVDVVGQEHVTQTLANAIASGRIAHAYLFCGPRGTGKTTLARIFAKALNCTGGPQADFDESDSRVREIAEGRSLDVMEIDGASNNGVEQVRELRETARFAPASSKFKIYIIDEVHMLSTAAFNALLKTLEEPPAHVKFLFATTDPEKVLPTILSRCQRFDLRRIPSVLIVKHLAWIAAQEKVRIDEPALQAIARGADGGMRDAESALDQLISFCGEEIAESDVLSMFGLAGRGQVLALTEAILGGQPEAALRVLDGIARSGKDLGRLLGDLLGHFRNLLLLQLSGGDTSLLEVTESELGVLRGQLTGIDADALTRILETLSAAEARIREAASRRIYLEVTLLKTIQARQSVSLDEVLKELRALKVPAATGAGSGTGERAPAGGAPRPVPSGVAAVPPAETRPGAAGVASIPAAAGREKADPGSGAGPVGGSASVSAAAPSRTAVIPPESKPSSPGGAPGGSGGGGGTGRVEAGPVDPAALWVEVVQSLGPLRASQYEDSRVVELKKGVLTVGFPVGSEHLELVSEKSAVQVIQAKLRERAGVEVLVKYVELPGLAAAKPSPVEATGAAAVMAPPVRATPGVAPAPKPKPAAPVQPETLSLEQYRNDPLIQQALEIFKAEIIEVRAPGQDAPAG